MQNERHDGDNLRLAKGACFARRHTGQNFIEQVVGGAITPGADEIAACQRQGFVAAFEVGQMAGGALGLKRGAACSGLLRGVRADPSGRRLLARLLDCLLAGNDGDA
ncbi:MAG TPA: hypothetical protein VG099_10560, partial [Gemmataceae bacterium]|nr:hypothetical protein [Gemmataceae bacterium]